MKQKLCVLITCALLVLPLVGCGDSKPGAVSTTATSLPAGKQLTVAEATLLSRLLFLNRDLGGADVQADVPYGLQSSIKIDGIVDWKTHTGTATVRVIGKDGKEVDTSTIFWRNLYDPKIGMVATTVKGLTVEMESSGRSGVKYVARPFSQSSPLDRVLRYLDGLATKQAENPLLLRQDAKAKSLGTEEIANGKDQIKATVLSYGRSRYWVDPKTGRMIQAAAPLAGLPTDTTFRFANHEVKTVTLPGPTEVVDVSDIPDIYSKLTKR